MRQVIKQMQSIRSMNVVVPVRDGSTARIRVVGKPDGYTADVLAQLGLTLPSRPKIIENVVETFGKK